MEMIDGLYLLLGTNLGNRIENIKEAMVEITARIGNIQKKSSVYETAAWGKTEQAPFLNAVVVVKSSLSPFEVLDTIHKIERDMGRVRKEKWKERVIDIDILYYNSFLITTPTLTIPHPEIAQRRFTLAPLCEIAPDLADPLTSKTQSQLLHECPDSLHVERLTNLKI